MKKCICLTISCILCFISFSQTWTSLGQGIPNGSISNQPAVNTIIEYNGILFAGGSITTAGGVTVNGGLAEWDGYGWHAGALPTSVAQMLVFNNELYAVGTFGVKKYVNDTTWADLGTGLDAGASAICVYNNELYVGGAFTHAGGNTAYHIAMWDGAAWHALNGGCDATVHSLAVYNNLLYVFGEFTQVDGAISVNYGAQWDGSSWSAIPGLPTTSLAPFCWPAVTYHDTLYFSGGNGNVYSYANGSATVFVPYSSNLIVNSEPTCFAVLFNKLYMSFYKINPLPYIYDGTGISTMDSGGYCYGEYNCQLVSSGASYYNSFGRLWTQPTAGFATESITACQNDTVAFTDTVCQGVTSRLWYFPGGSPNTSTLENPAVAYPQPGTYDVSLIITNPAGTDTAKVSNYITVIAAPAVPTITQIGNILVSSASTGNAWYVNDTLISNTANLDTLPADIAYRQCYSVTVSNGSCSATSDTVCVSPVTTVGMFNLAATGLTVYPNPSSGEFYVSFEGANTETQILISDLLGKRVYEESFTDVVGSVTHSIKAGNLASGIYIVTLRVAGESTNEKIVIN